MMQKLKAASNTNFGYLDVFEREQKERQQAQ